jgi:hypothetical protein
MATGEAAGCVVDVHHPDIMRRVLERVLATGDVLGRGGRTVRVRGIPPAT